jgi:hypothetical protein
MFKDKKDMPEEIMDISDSSDHKEIVEPDSSSIKEPIAVSKDPPYPIDVSSPEENKKPESTSSDERSKADP